MLMTTCHLVTTQVQLLKRNYTVCHKKEPLIFDYNSRISWSIFIIPPLMETGTNTPQSHVIYLLNYLMTS